MNSGAGREARGGRPGPLRASGRCVQVINGSKWSMGRRGQTPQPGSGANRAALGAESAAPAGDS